MDNMTEYISWYQAVSWYGQEVPNCDKKKYFHEKRIKESVYECVVNMDTLPTDGSIVNYCSHHGEKYEGFPTN
jgi:hypothetical protein